MLVKMVVVEVRDPDGRVVKRVTANEELFKASLKLARESGDDLLTLWIYRILVAILAPAVVGGVTSATYTDTTGTSRIQDFKKPMYPYNSPYPNLSDFFNTGYCANRLWISYGSDRTPPTRSDYKLGSKLNEAVATMTYDESARTMTFTAGWTLTADTTIYEVGLEWEATVATGTTCGRVLVDRTVFPDGVTVLAGQTLTITYVISVP
jgi:hypothetical protein